MNHRDVISDEVWAIIEPLLPSTEGKRGGRHHDHRPVIEGIAYKFRTGCPWRDVPAEFGPWQTLWKRHDTWSADGTWQEILRPASWTGRWRWIPRWCGPISTPPAPVTTRGARL